MKHKKTLFFLLMLQVGVLTTQAQDNQTRVKHFNIDKYNVALAGYDVISYFEGKPVKGVSSIFFFL